MLLDKCFDMFQSNAYLHHYSRYGIEREHFTEFAFPVLEQVVANYEAL